VSSIARKPGACEREPMRTGYLDHKEAQRVAIKWMKKRGGKAWVEMCADCGLYHVQVVEEQDIK
jgi:hypothetical protein